MVRSGGMNARAVRSIPFFLPLHASQVSHAVFRLSHTAANGKVSVFEFIKAMREFGIEEPPNAIVAVFNSFDKVMTATGQPTLLICCSTLTSLAMTTLPAVLGSPMCPHFPLR